MLIEEQSKLQSELSSTLETSTKRELKLKWCYSELEAKGEQSSMMETTITELKEQVSTLPLPLP